MTETASTPKDEPRHQVRRTATRSNWWIMASIIGIVVVATLWPMFQAWRAVNAFEQTALDANYALKQGVTIIIDEPITEPTYLRGFESVEVHHGSDAELAIASSHATLDGTFTKTIAFMGKELVILPTAVLEGDLQIAAAKSVTIRGVVQGEILGNVGRIFRPEALEEPSPPASMP